MKSMALKDWLAVIGLTCAAFVFNTSEFIPIGLLSDIAADFKITEADAGMLISVYAWVVMLLSMPLMMLVSKMELRKLMLWVVVVFSVFQVLSSVSTGYYMLMGARIGVACSHAVFWSIVSPLAVRIVPDKCRALAMSMIVTGTSVAMIFGLPLGRIIGLHIGWSNTFLCIGLFWFLTFFYLLCVLPKVPSKGGLSWSRLPQLFKNPLLLGLYALALLFATSYYTAYSYIEPFLKQVASLSDGWVTATLMIFGATGILGSIAFEKYYNRNPMRFIGVMLGGMTLCLLLLYPASFALPAVVLLCALWGIPVTAFNVALQAEIINDSPLEATSVSMSIFSGIFNLGIGSGALIGGYVCTYSSMAYIGFAGFVLAVAAIAYWRKHLVRLVALAHRK